MAERKPGQRVRRTTRRTATAARENPEALTEVDIDIEEGELSDFEESANVMIYGPPGHGKTRLAGFAPNAHFISTEKGAVSAQRAGATAGIWRVPTWQHVVSAVKRAEQRYGPDDWVILDSLTKMQVLMIRWILEVQQASNPLRDLDIPAIQDHQKWQNYFKRFVDRLIDAKFNTIFICTQMRREDANGDDEVIPAITGKDYQICDYVCAQMDVILYYAVTTQTSEEGIIRRALAQPYPPFVSPKDRYDVLGRWQDVAEGDTTAMAEFIDMFNNPYTEE